MLSADANKKDCPTYTNLLKIIARDQATNLLACETAFLKDLLVMCTSPTCQKNNMAHFVLLIDPTVCVRQYLFGQYPRNVFFVSLKI